MKPKFTNFLLAASICATLTAQAASDTWLAAPVDGLWSNSLNWVGGNVPGLIDGDDSPDTATFGTSTGLAVTVDANRNIQNITFNANNTYTLSGGSLRLSSGGTILANGSSASQNIAATTPMLILDDGGSYKIETNTPGGSRVLVIGSPISGSSSEDFTTTLFLDGTSTTINSLNGAITDGLNGGQLAVEKNGTGLWAMAAGSFTGGLTVNAGTMRTGNSGNTNVLLGSGPITFNGGTVVLGSTNASNFNNPLVVNDDTTSFLTFRSNHSFNPASASGTGTLVLGHSNSAATAVTTANAMNFSGTLRIVPNGANGTTLRLGNGFVDSSLQNAAIDLRANTFISRQNGTNSTFTATIGSLSGEEGAALGGSAAGNGTFIYNIGNRNEDSVFSGSIVDGGSKTAITKIGTGKLTLNGDSTHTAATTVDGGILEIAGFIQQNSALNVINGEAIIDTGGNVITSLFNGPGPGVGSNGTLTVKGEGEYLSNGELNIGDTGDTETAATGTLRIQDTAIVTVGAAAGVYVGSGFFENTLAVGTIEQSGGTFTANNLSAGSFVIGGRTSTLASGTYNLSGGTATISGQAYIGGQGSGTLNLSNTAELTTSAGLRIGNGEASTGIVNLNGGTLSTSLIDGNAGTSSLNFNGGTIIPLADDTEFITGLTSATLLTGGVVFDTNELQIAIPQSIGGTGPLTKSGDGVLILSGSNTYTGTTTVLGGTLGVTGTSISNNAVLVIDGGIVNVPADVNESVGKLFFGDVEQAIGTYGSPSSAATNQSANFTGTGIITVTGDEGGSDFETWIGSFGIAPGELDPTDDPDGDGLTNAQEYAFGLNPNDGSSVSPIVALLDQSTGTFTYTRRKQSLTGIASYKVWTSTTLATGSWVEDTDATQAPTSISTDNESVLVTLSDDKPLTAPKLFVRISAE